MRKIVIKFSPEIHKPFLFSAPLPRTPATLPACSPRCVNPLSVTPTLPMRTALLQVLCALAQSCLTLCDSMDCSCQAPLSMEFSRQDYWSGLPFPTPGDLADPGIEAASLVSPALAGRFFITGPPGKPPLAASKLL